MQDSQFGFSYSWSDLWQVPVLTSTLVLAELAGGAVGWLAWFPSSAPHPFVRAWIGAALAMVPGYALGLLLQWRWQPERLSAHKVMVRRIGLLATALWLVALWMCLSGADRSFHSR